MSLHCQFGHAWAKWSAPQLRDFQERVWSENDNLPPEWRPRKILVQERTCERCGLYQVRHVKLQEME